MGAVVVESYWMNYVQYEVGCRTVTHAVSVRVETFKFVSFFVSTAHFVGCSGILFSSLSVHALRQSHSRVACRRSTSRLSKI